MIGAVELTVQVAYVFSPYYEKMAGALSSACKRSEAVRYRGSLMIGGTDTFLNSLKDYEHPQLVIEQATVNNNVNACSMFIDHVDLRIMG